MLTSENDKKRIVDFIQKHNVSVFISKVDLSNGTFYLNRSYTLPIKYMTEYLGISHNTYTNWKKSTTDCRKGAKHPNAAKYSEEDRKRALDALLLNPDLTPPEIQAKYLDEHSIYLGSVRWLYRLLEENKCNANRGATTNNEKKDTVERRTLTATAPNQVYVWDITYLYKSNPIGEYYYLYAVMDLYSRKIIHAEVHDSQTAELAAKFIETAVKKAGFIKPKKSKLNQNGVNKDIFGKVLELHSDNGAPMRGSTMLSKCTELGISCTYNRPRHSNDNAHMEASFRLLKHGHEIVIPESFDSLKHAREWVNEYYDWYNNEHRHSGICYITPNNCYNGLGPSIMEHRNQVIRDFYSTHSEQEKLIKATRKTFTWEMPKSVTVMPFYTKRAKVKNIIRSKKLDSGKYANVGKAKVS